MHSISDARVKRLYRVEVSGWDIHEAYFVEQSELEWDEDCGKKVVLKHALHESAMIFVRLLQPIEPERAFPVAYEAEFLGHLPEDRQEFRLKQIRPRQGLRKF